MPLPDYQVKVFSPTTGAIVRVFDMQSMESLRYSRVLNGVGSLVMTFPSDDTVLDSFPLDALIEVERVSPITNQLRVEDTYLQRLTHRFLDGNAEKVIVGGQSLNHLLMRRIIDPDDDPSQAGGYSTKAGAADSVMRAYALEQCGPSASVARQFPNLTVPSVPGVGQNTGKRLRHENLLSTLKSIADETMIDFRIVRVSENDLELRIGRIGQDRTKDRNYPFAPFVYLTPIRGNLSNPSLLFDRKEEKNFAYALGQGPGDTRIVLRMSGNGTGDSPYNRIEFTVDAGNTERGNALGILTEAREALRENEARIEFTFDLSGHQAGNIYRQNWDLGDSVTTAWEGAENNVRIIEVELNLSASGEELTIKTELE